MYNHLDPQDIIGVVCRSLEISDITSHGRCTEFAHARFIAIWLMLRYTKLSYQEIGAAVGRDKTTVYWAEARCKELTKQREGKFLSKWNHVNEKMESQYL
jgi:chromosomal replication initiation ATPase DnaA